jgi:hypothetical protein
MGKEAATKPAYKTEPGPQEGRSCRDILFLLLFLLFNVGLLIIAVVAITKGDLNR